MGHIEEEARKSRKRRNIQSAVLSAVGIAGTLAVAAVAPNIFQALPHIMGRQKYKLRFQTKTAIGRLLVKGYLRKNAKGYLEITERGSRYLAIQKARTDNPASAKRRWDKRYRIVMFDIPQSMKNTRDRLRALMTEFGFLRLQDSVWITPYDCEDIIVLVKKELRIGKEVLYVVADQIENDGWIKKHFNLH